MKTFLLAFNMLDYDNSEASVTYTELVTTNDEQILLKRRDEFKKESLDQWFEEDKEAFLKEHPEDEFTREGFDKDIDEDYGYSVDIIELDLTQIKQL